MTTAVKDIAETEEEPVLPDDYKDQAAKPNLTEDNLTDTLQQLTIQSDRTGQEFTDTTPKTTTTTITKTKTISTKKTAQPQEPEKQPTEVQTIQDILANTHLTLVFIPVLLF